MNILYILIIFFIKILTFHSSILKYSIDYLYLKIMNTPLAYNAEVFSTKIQTDSLRFHPPECLYGNQNNSSPVLKYENCNVLALMNLTVTILPNYTFIFKDFYIDFYYKEMRYEMRNKAIIPKINLDIDNNNYTQPFSFNLNRAPLSSAFFQNITIILGQAGETLRNQYNSIIENAYQNVTGKTQLEADLVSAFTLMFLDSVVYRNKDSEVTYYAFHVPKMTNIINLREITVIESLTIIFEYSKNYNLTYQEGNFTIYNFVFEKMVMNNEIAFDKYIYKYFNPPDEREEIKKYLFDRFKYWVVSSLKKLYSQKEELENGEMAWEVDPDFDT